MAIAVDSEHDVVFTASSADNTVSSFIYNPDTGETAHAYTIGSGGTFPRRIALDETNRLLFVVNRDSPNIGVFKYQTDGALEAVAGSPFAVSGTQPTSVAVDPDSSRRIVFVALSGSAEVESLAYSTAGALTSKKRVSSDGTRPYDLAVDSAGQLMFVINQDSRTMSSFVYDSEGTMTRAGSLGTGGATPYAVALDAAAGHAFVANEGASSIGLFTYDSAGALSAVGLTVSSNGTNPRGLVFVP